MRKKGKKNLKVLVTGGAGYIGSVLVPKLLQAGHDVTVVDNFVYRTNSLAQCMAHPRFDVYKLDCRDIRQIKPHLGSADVVIPLAALVGAPLCAANPIDAKLLNLDAHLDLWKVLSPNQFVIMPNTESLYGKNGGICTEEVPINALSTYATYKAEAEKALLDRGNCISLRLATVFGFSPRMRLDLLVNDFTWRAFKDRAFMVFEGAYRRTCVHIQDVTDAFLHALTLQGIYNVGSCWMTKIELCEAIQKQVPEFRWIEVDYESDPDQRDYIVSDEKLRKTGFIPKWTLEAGIAELLKGYRMLFNARYTNG